jgi:hypothetical protein
MDIWQGPMWGKCNESWPPMQPAGQAHRLIGRSLSWRRPLKALALAQGLESIPFGLTSLFKISQRLPARF